MLRTYRKSDRSGFNPLFLQLLRIQLRVCGSGRMNHQRLHIGHIGQQREYLQTIDKLLRFLRSSLYLELTAATFGWFTRKSITFKALATCRSTRKDKVSNPCSKIKALNGLMAAPVSRSNTARIRTM